jgi:hypothetical protein
MVFRLIASEAPDLTTLRLVGRLRDDGVILLDDACTAAKRPLVLDLSELTGASDAAVLLLRRLAGAGVHLVGASPYVRLLLDQPRNLLEPRRSRALPRQAPGRGRARRRS